MKTQTLVCRELYPKASIPLETDHAPSNALDFRSSDQTLDRYQEVITVAGWKLDNYRKNPVVQNAHSYWSIADTIGKSLITEIRSGAGVPPAESDPSRAGFQPASPGPSRAGFQPASPGPSGAGVSPASGPYLFQRIQFAVEVNPLAKLAYGLYQGGFLNAVSVGFIPIRWEDGNAEAGYRRKYLEQELLEVSAVCIPANPNALACGLKAGAIEKSDVEELVGLLRNIQLSTFNLQLPTAGKELTAQLNEIRTLLKRA